VMPLRAPEAVAPAADPRSEPMVDVVPAVARRAAGDEGTGTAPMPVADARETQAELTSSSNPSGTAMTFGYTESRK
jgi:hypothetical protein